jgi:hypothetical protein
MIIKFTESEQNDCVPKTVNMVLGNAFYKTKGQMAKVKAAGKKVGEDQIRNQII